MESLLFNYLKDKATDEVTMNNLAYTTDDHQKYTYKDLYQLVLNKISNYQKKDVWGKTPYIIVRNDIRSIANLIALISLGYSPLIINGDGIIPIEEDGRLVDIKTTIKETNADNMINRMTYSMENKIVNDYISFNLDMKKLDQRIQKNKSSIKVGEPGFGKIGICTSGSMGDPKTVFIDEKTIIDNIFSSKYNNRYRKIYNQAPLSSISGLTTNLFMPIVGSATEVQLTNKFNMLKARFATDVYLPRNFLDYITPYAIEAEIEIEKIFIYGEQNSEAVIKKIRDSINLPPNVFVNVFGTTECGGLVCECEEEDFKDNVLYVYYCDIDNDTIVYSIKNREVHKKVGDKDIRLTRDKAEEYLKSGGTKYIPCGKNSNRITIDKNKTIGECIVDNKHNTEDIITILNGRIYVLGRKKHINENRYLANPDGEIASLINKNCATFTDENNNLCLAIRYDFKDPDKFNDKQANYFRRLLKEYKKVVDIINHKYPYQINEIFFFPEYKFTLSAGIKKPQRNQFKPLVNEGRQTNYRLEHYDEVLKKQFELVCQKQLGYVPKYRLNEGKSILIDKDSITEEQIVDLINDLKIVLVLCEYETGDYYIMYDDSYFFDDAVLRNNRLSDFQLEYLKRCAKYGIFKEELALINNEYAAKDGVFNYYDAPHFWERLSIYYRIATTEDNKTIIIPFHAIEAETDKKTRNLKIPIPGVRNFFEDQKQEHEDKANTFISEAYPNLVFTTERIIVPLPTSEINHLDYLGKTIEIDNNDGSIKVYGNKYHNKNIDSYCYGVIARKYRMSHDEDIKTYGKRIIWR